MFNIFKRLFSKKESTFIKSVEPLSYAMPSSIDEIIQNWRQTDLKLNDPAPDNLINEAQQTIDYIFPDDFLRFYRQVNGFKDWDMVGEMFSIWPLNKIAEEYKKSDDKNFVPFCDFCLDCHRIGYLKDHDGIYKDYDRTRKIADNFEETINLIIADSELLH